MTEEQALAMSTGRFSNNLVGYLPWEAAYFLVGTGQYEFFRTHELGHVLKKVADDTYFSDLNEAA